VVSIIATKGNRVRLGISAPEEVTVYREEVWQRICQEAQDAPHNGAIRKARSQYPK
jgi:carbon storage regulator